VALGRGDLAPKEREGDGRTPEGHYIIDSRNGASHYHKALHVSYPNAEDRARAAKLGASPGGAIMIHGLPNGMGWLGAAHRLYDWTLGCIAVTDEEIDEIWNLVPVGTPVEIRRRRTPPMLTAVGHHRRPQMKCENGSRCSPCKMPASGLDREFCSWRPTG